MANPNGGIAGGPATAAMRRQDNNTFLGNFVHWLWFGRRPGSGLAALPGQFFSSVDPRSRAGLVNLASMFAGGGKFDASPKMGELGMSGQFEPYSVGKAAVGGHLGHDKAPDAFLEALKTGNHQHAHDLLFGGTVHARGGIPQRPSFNAPPTDAAAAIAQKLGISPARVRAQMQAAEQHNANVAHEQIIARVLRNHGLAPYRPKEAEATDISHTRSMGQKAHAATNIFHPALKAQRQEALRQLLNIRFRHN